MMPESKFTKGPLSVKENNWQDDPWEIFAGDTYIGVAIETGTEGEAKANAELMADAPRMLEVLRTLHDFALPLRERGLAAESEQAFADARALLEKHGG
jgi:hypothetical protein